MASRLPNKSSAAISIPAVTGSTCSRRTGIENATTLAAYVAASPQKYRDAIDRCLLQVKQANGELQAIYARLHALYPDRALPQIYVVFGRGNSGGTAGPGAQVLGLEVLCETAPDAAALRRTLRRFFAHETVHTWQGEPAGDDRNPLLEQVLIEGAADYIAALATGAAPDADRAAWALPRETLLWAAFQRDLAIMHTAYRTDAMDSAASNDAAHRWIENYGAAPDGWPFELGYWIGMRMWERYVAASPDRDQALRDVLDWRDANAVSARAGAPNIVATQQTR